MKEFLLNFLNGLITSTVTFLIVIFLPLPTLPMHLEKIAIFTVVAVIIGIVLFRDKPMVHQIGTIIGGVLGGFIIFNYGLPSTAFIENTFIGGIIVGIVATLSKFLGV